MTQYPQWTKPWQGLVAKENDPKDRIEKCPKAKADFVNSDVTGRNTHFIEIDGQRFWMLTGRDANKLADFLNNSWHSEQQSAEREKEKP